MHFKEQIFFINFQVNFVQKGLLKLLISSMVLFRFFHLNIKTKVKFCMGGIRFGLP